MAGVGPGHVDSLRSIDLETLQFHADLQHRRDRKYIVDAETVHALLEDLPLDDAAVLDIEGRRCFRYESTYFDTPDLDSYLSTARRRRQRFKVRSRRYLESDLCVLEVKRKGPRGATTKHRLDYDEADRSRILPSVRDEIAELAGRERGLVDLLTPRLTTEYRRVTLVDRSTWSRCTIDVDLVCSDIDGSVADFGDHLIIETKSSGAAGAIDRWLWRRDRRPISVSKYCVGLAALHPELPDNRWSRTLRRHPPRITTGTGRSALSSSLR